jgi:ferritin-like metal-binding protein YciE
VFQRSLAEEQAMDDWLAAHIDSTTQEYLRREMTAAATG